MRNKGGFEHICRRDPPSRPPVITPAEGVILYDQEDQRILAAASGAAVVCLGHNCPRLIKTPQEQAGKVIRHVRQPDSTSMRGGGSAIGQAGDDILIALPYTISEA